MMKHIVTAAVLILLGSASTSCFAADNKDSEKDWCLLKIESKCSGTTTLDLNDKIRRLNTAIDKGTSVYTPEELEHLKHVLEEALWADSLLRVR
ncbi:hypothetical protein [Geobacter sp. SVR]|uniref:hypothetical protein n=1 Tax=Geobacter sp. SVR TaxID=2495594 RepID=UPI00143F018D|nr:hypothetical protein [Geobacter sp. SVR]BCS52698.1 hypothetical protein GSVR_10060 [Geobacter sp. SVR]GCF86806.1 hypothetical protein GSbR_34060 [Geobacter sp. SVR]